MPPAASNPAGKAPVPPGQGLADAAAGLRSLGSSSKSPSTDKKPSPDQVINGPASGTMPGKMSQQAMMAGLGNSSYNQQMGGNFPMGAASGMQSMGYGPMAAMHMQSFPNPMDPNGFMAMDRFSMAERMTAMERAMQLPGGGAGAAGGFNPYGMGMGMGMNMGGMGMNMGGMNMNMGMGGMNNMGMNMTRQQQPLHSPHRTTNSGTVPSTKNFPETLFDVINRPEHNHIVSWLPHGRGFIIHDKRLFADMILPRYFDGAKFTSFTRRLKRWSFVRVARGPELGAYYNDCFVRDQPMLVQRMRYRMEGQAEEAKKRVGGHSEGQAVAANVQVQVPQFPELSAKMQNPEAADGIKEKSEDQTDVVKASDVAKALAEEQQAEADVKKEKSEEKVDEKKVQGASSANDTNQATKDDSAKEPSGDNVSVPKLPEIQSPAAAKGTSPDEPKCEQV